MSAVSALIPVFVPDSVYFVFGSLGFFVLLISNGWKSFIEREIMFTPTPIQLFAMCHGDLLFSHRPDENVQGILPVGWTLEIEDTYSKVSGKHRFNSESEMLRFVGEYLIHTDQPSEEFRNLFPMHC